MPISGQILKRVKFKQLKSLRDVDIDFQGNQLTAIMGKNGDGKSTIIHALACINKPPILPAGLVNYRFMDFFLPTSHSNWAGSEFEVVQDFRNGPVVSPDQVMIFRKQTDRWAPRYDTRIERYISYIGIRTAVPQVEKETIKTRIQFNNIPIAFDNAPAVMRLAGQVMRRQYNNLNFLTAFKKSYISVQLNGVDYSSLSMGAGEQRVFHILSEVVRAPNNALVLIDEIDILLHHDALKELLVIINEIAVRKNLQVIFTTHAHSILDCDFINFRHLLQTPTMTLCFNETKPDALQRLTGVSQRPLEIFVEDHLANAIVKKIAGQLRLSKYLSIKMYGVASNCFTSVAGAILNGLDNLENMLFVLDGDVLISQEEKEREIRRALSGNAPITLQRREEALSKITEFVLPLRENPEHYYHNLICLIDNDQLSPEEREIVDVARQIHNVPDAHRFFEDIISRMDFEPAVGLSKLVDLLSKSNEWARITNNVREWLFNKIPQIHEQDLERVPAIA
jgi:Fe-S cluster assembly ATPase SufC